MKGYIRKRGTDSWEVRVYLGKDKHGKKHYRYQTVRGGKRYAQQQLAKLVTEVRPGAPAEGPISVDLALAEWLPRKSLNVAPRTAEGYRNVINNYINPALGDRRMHLVTAKDIDDLYTSLQERGLSAQTVRHVHNVLRQVFKQRRRLGNVQFDPTEDAELPRVPKKEVPNPSIEHIRALVSHTTEEIPDFGTMFYFVAVTGCRRGEAIGVRWTDLDFRSGDVTIRRSLGPVKGGVHVTETKGGEIRRVALDYDTLTLLQTHCERAASIATVCDVELVPDPYVFSREPDGSKPWHPDHVSHVFGRMRRASGVPKTLRLHDFRHNAATLLVRDGASIGDVMDRLGWKSVSMVDRYRHAAASHDRDRRAAASMGRAVAGAE